MNYKNVTISVYGIETQPITSAIKQVLLEGYNISIRYPVKPEIIEKEIIIIQEKEISNPVIQFFIKQLPSYNEIIFIAPEDDALFISSLLKSGFSSFFIFPYERFKFIDHLTEIILQSPQGDESQRKTSDDSFSSLIANSREMKKIIDISRKIADKTNINILITGETGTGKGMLARSIHNFASKGMQPYVDITCTAIPETLLESELFGYEPGAFTNARVLKPGLFEVAEMGTLFLDEIGDLSLTIQSKLLRTIEKKVVRRLGGITDIPISARIISATNKNLEQQIENNSFRRDLYHRLNTVTIELPPLRNRGNDILSLVNYFMGHFNNLYKKDIKKIEPRFKDFLMNYSWPGNIRELRNYIERSILLSGDSTMKMIHSTDSFLENSRDNSYKNNHPSYINLSLDYEKYSLKKVERIYAKETLNKLNGNKSRTAKILEISRPKLDDLLKS